MTEENNDFIGEFEEMDLTELFDKQFMVAISEGDRNKHMFMPSSLCGPFDFFEMVETVANVWIDKQLHAKAIITKKKFGNRPKVLNENTIDYIEAKHQDILMEGLITGDIVKDYTCKAGFTTDLEPQDDNKKEAKADE